MSGRNGPPPPFTARTLIAGDDGLVRQAGQLLVDAFVDLAPAAWPDLDAGIAEIRGLLDAGHYVRAALDEGGRVAGLIGGQTHYGGTVWELHPLAVRADCRGRGLGRWLVEDLAGHARANGGLTLWLGSDDETGLTSLSGKDLYPDPLAELGRLEDTGGHPFTFYRHLGFAVTGVMPDANGRGKPDIFMARKL